MVNLRIALAVMWAVPLLTACGLMAPYLPTDPRPAAQRKIDFTHAMAALAGDYRVIDSRGKDHSFQAASKYLHVKFREVNGKPVVLFESESNQQWRMEGYNCLGRYENDGQRTHVACSFASEMGGGKASIFWVQKVQGRELTNLGWDPPLIEPMMINKGDYVIAVERTDIKQMTYFKIEKLQ